MNRIRLNIIAPILIIGMLGYSALYPKARIFGKSYSHGARNSNKIAITFDDGPNPPYTDEILEILKQRNVKATFFLIGENVDTYPELARRIVLEGHEVGNHTYTHPDLLFHRKNTILDEINLTQAAITRATGVTANIFRPPYGFRDMRVLRAAKKSSLKVIEWSDMSFDWRSPGVEKVEKRTINHLRGGDIILLHDGFNTIHGGDRSDTVNALPAILDSINEKGLIPVTISELLFSSPNNEK